MTTSITRRFLAHVIRSLTYILWVADLGTGLRPVFYFLIVIYSVLFIGIRNADLGGVINGIILSSGYTPPGEFSLERSYPLKPGFQLPPAVSAISAGVFDRGSGKMLFSRLPEEKLAPASTTKLMTALVALELYSPEERVVVPYFCMKNTNFVNPIGLDGFKGVHYSTVSDLYLLALASLSNETVQDAVKTKEFKVRSLTSDFTYQVTNTNRFLWEIAGTTGIKTGTTVGAGEVLIYSWQDRDRELVLVVMGSRDRFTDTRNLLNWSLDNYAWKNE